MKINLDFYLEQELLFLTSLINKTLGWKQIDENAFEKKFGERNVIMVIYPELLRYGYVYRPGVSGNKKTSEEHAVVWLACRIELEGDANTKWHSDVLKDIKKWWEENIILKPFYDEDAPHGIYSRQCSAYSRDWTQYVFYVNPDYPEGWWENHCLG